MARSQRLCYSLWFSPQMMVEDVLVMCLQSFLRVKLRRGMPVMDHSGAPGRQEHNNLLLKEIMAAALEVFRVYVNVIIFSRQHYMYICTGKWSLGMRLGSGAWE